MSINIYNPANSKISDNTFANFLRLPLTGNILEIPGISKKQAILLARGDIGDQITSSFQLIGKFLLMKSKNKDEDKNENNDGDDGDDGDDSYDYINPKKHCQLFYNYLKNKGITTSRNDIVMAIAEKSNTIFPGMYDYTYYN